MRKTFPTHKLLRLPPALQARITDYRFTRRHSFEADALRALLEAGLAAEEAAAKGRHPGVTWYPAIDGDDHAA